MGVSKWSDRVSSSIELLTKAESLAWVRFSTSIQPLMYIFHSLKTLALKLHPHLHMWTFYTLWPPCWHVGRTEEGGEHSWVRNANKKVTEHLWCMCKPHRIACRNEWGTQNWPLKLVFHGRFYDPQIPCEPIGWDIRISSVRFCVRFPVFPYRNGLIHKAILWGMHTISKNLFKFQLQANLFKCCLLNCYISIICYVSYSLWLYTLENC